ncbi:hypothetical protein SAMN05444266_10822 [Chitinophaga jiangningensis]|uniref:Uncharacterized protein n=1 Tax=Chitinophaga jiangningensis TaxID=1419482 RepID=A0A1M7IMM5_9BACT|nr:hypothetical protein [Chitinophaga jiangningensis]SHM41853.1 hypothetical protein SAMN05444266_10822 [Chitinophaga jiangningensis]
MQYSFFTQKGHHGQFIEMYRDAAHSQLFGWMCSYPAPDHPGRVVELWALMAAEDVTLSGVAFYPVQVTTGFVPHNFDTWLLKLREGPAFEALVYRMADFELPDTKKSFTGTLVNGIYNSNGDPHVKPVLVAVTLMSAQRQLDEQAAVSEQLMLMGTFEASEPMLLYSPLKELDPPITSQEFLEGKGVPGITLTGSKATVPLRERVLTMIGSTSPEQNIQRFIALKELADGITIHG